MSIFGISFPLPWAEKGKTLDIDASSGICDYTSELCAKMVDKKGMLAQIVDILVMSPTLKRTIYHRVVVADGSFIIDVPQTELLKWAEGKDWTHVRAIMSNGIAPEFAGLKAHLQGEQLSPEWLFKPEDTPIPDYFEDYQKAMIKDLLGRVDNPQSTGGEYPTWTGTYKDMPVKYDANYEDFYYIPKQELQWTTAVFEPRMIPLTPTGLEKAYAVDGKELLVSITKQLDSKGGKAHVC